jgi:hypothetical protein
MEAAADANGPLWMSEILGLQPNTQAAPHVPQDFTLRHAAHAHHRGKIGFGVTMTWLAPGDQPGYVLAVLGPEIEERWLGAEETRAIEVLTSPSCFMVVTEVGGSSATPIASVPSRCRGR